MNHSKQSIMFPTCLVGPLLENQGNRMLLYQSFMTGKAHIESKYVARSVLRMMGSDPPWIPSKKGSRKLTGSRDEKMAARVVFCHTGA